MDGKWSEITIKANGKSKTITVLNYTQDQFNKVRNEIARLVRAKIGEKAFDFTDFLNDCPEKELECKGIESAECWDWKFYCKWEEIEPEKFSAEYCDKLKNRKECIEYCEKNECSKELCDSLMFDAENCEECSVGCCSYCSDLDSCSNAGCRIAWIHPSGESWQYGKCENVNLCKSIGELCDYISKSYQGYHYTSLIEENPDKASYYEKKAGGLQELYNTECK